MNHYTHLVLDLQRQFYALGLNVHSTQITRDCIRVTLPYADTLLTADIIYDGDDADKGHEIALVALGVCSRKTRMKIMQAVMHDITKATLFQGILALYNVAKEEQMLETEQILDSKSGGAAFRSRLPGIEYLNAEDHSWIHCKVPLSQVSIDGGPPR